MVRSFKAFFAMVLLASSIPASADAAAILITDNRNIGASASAFSGPDSDHDGDSAVPPAPFAPFNDGVVADASTGTALSHASATQNSSITTTLFTGSGRLSLTSQALGLADPEESAPANAFSFFDIFFHLSEAHTFDLSGLLSAHGTGSGSLPSALSSFSLNGPVTFQFTADAFANGGSSTELVSHSGVLPVGDYQFFAGSTGGVAASSFLGIPTQAASADFTFTFELNPTANPVPEPASVMLLGIGAAALSGIRKPRRGSRPSVLPPA